MNHEPSFRPIRIIILSMRMLILVILSIRIISLIILRQQDDHPNHPNHPQHGENILLTPGLFKPVKVGIFRVPDEELTAFHKQPISMHSNEYLFDN